MPKKATDPSVKKDKKEKKSKSRIISLFSSNKPTLEEPVIPIEPITPHTRLLDEINELRDQADTNTNTTIPFVEPVVNYDMYSSEQPQINDEIHYEKENGLMQLFHKITHKLHTTTVTTEPTTTITTISTTTTINTPEIDTTTTIVPVTVETTKKHKHAPRVTMIHQNTVHHPQQQTNNVQNNHIFNVNARSHTPSKRISQIPMIIHGKN